ncbi:MAG: hypothetical protein ACI8P9_005818 [Parasphingorhabdus sp.]|jgi:hypothetical protein
MSKLLRVTVLLLWALAVSACSSFPKYPVNVVFIEEPIKTTVDSEIAQYYLTDYLQGNKSRPETDNEIDNLYEQQTSKLPDRSFLERLSKEYSTDFAALFLADRIWNIGPNRKLQRAFHQKLSLPRSQLYQKPETRDEYIILLIPGWNYVANGKITGSDFSSPRKLIDDLGIENHLVRVPTTGSVFQSAEVIVESILRFSQDGRKIIVVGASAAGPAIHYTLGKRLSPQQLGSVVAWINLGGILQGSPLIDYFQNWPQKILLNLAIWIRGWDNEEILTMSAEQSRRRIKTLALPPNLLVINYLGLSLTGDLSHLSRYKYPIIKSQGPNDGLTPLIDIIAPDSRTLIATASDHYFGQDPRINDKTIAVLKMVMELTQSKILP